MIERHQRFCIWAGLTFGPLLCIGLAIAGFFIPPSPNLNAQEIATMFEENRTSIRIGILITTLASPLLAFFVAALSHQLRRIVGGSSALVTAQTVAGACLILEFIFPQMIWQAAAFRPERSPEIIQTLHDMAWLMYVGVVGTAVVQMLIMAIVILQDPRPQPLLPRWTAYVCFWAALGVSGGSFCVFFQSGLLAWNGIIAWWLLVVSFFVWMVALCWQMLKASHYAERNEPALTN